jgi:hypothetical protein
MHSAPLQYSRSSIWTAPIGVSLYIRICTGEDTDSKYDSCGRGWVLDGPASLTEAASYVAIALLFLSCKLRRALDCGVKSQMFV